MADLMEKMVKQWADLFIKNSKATEAVQVAAIKGFVQAVPEWQKATRRTMNLKDTDEWPLGLGSDKEFLDYAEKHRERLGFPQEVDFGKLKEWRREWLKTQNRE